MILRHIVLQQNSTTGYEIHIYSICVKMQLMNGQWKYLIVFHFNDYDVERYEYIIHIFFLSCNVSIHIKNIKTTIL